ncbi:hydroxyacylglutathione hydrolase [Buchnera aphidicola str. APS (Acyrthosiphon pisum)]|uniref:Hydroxyacylglutathione hydrolase n=2 Tax=Buchnera aphidicola TaxID=9 RepID=GLO2_BUCAI|nr:hydroxyacylglutathione hydrolase [Buchnera aphidicola]P57336.1 RecName: Full=Hydroxyacylglutathione hydrolase; AltName: Full=Glyoxalase II; Short=Glx II [Buchnera aphidicola str. APS (Acyrthosiphon pisum)]pir/F84958/ probable hydroxyacylglutathione hydrolase (EC 3.1.2.6) [imported] - Buchnera sp. (strain APS) [Buchnera sp. (in: enterobacteria)]ADP66640.1 probable hydroxyacylglutathione hydrolase [Buchnera aphidicola str. TLW03 (Acyrthosiphon pisum)]ADP67753.1 probable hydroxyacylglutathione 
MILKKISILSDNYVWVLLNTSGSCIIIDPGLSEPIIQEIERKKWRLRAILLTHNHIDHTGGTRKIIEYFPKISVFGPKETRQHGVNKIVSHGDRIILLDKIFYVFFTPGHTSGHVSYYSQPYIFCGDTLFSAGCGRVFKNKHLEMYRSIKIISSLPDSTLLCCSHEYTLSNLQFSMFILPNDNFIKLYLKKIEIKLKLGQSSLPSYIFFEKKINLFLRTNDNYVKKSIGLKSTCTDFEVFKRLRLKKDFWS